MGAKASAERDVEAPLDVQRTEAPPVVPESNAAPPESPRTTLLIVDPGAEGDAGAVSGDQPQKDEPDREKRTKKPRAIRRHDDDRVRWVRVAGAGLNDVNGVYHRVADFDNAEMFKKDAGAAGFFTHKSDDVYIRQQGVATPNVWVITLSPDPSSGSDHLYKREKVKKTDTTPPLMGWVACTAAEGVPAGRAAELANGLPELEYHNAPPGSTVGKLEWNSSKRGGTSSRGDPTSSLGVSIIGATNLPDTDTPVYDAHCACVVPGNADALIESLAASGSKSPEWMFTSPLESWKPNDDLHFTVYKDGSNKNEDMTIGEVTLEYDIFRHKGFVGEVPLKLADSDDLDAKLNICITMPGQATPCIEIEIKEDPDANMGIDIAPEWNMGSLSIRKIREGGLVDKWNQDHPAQRVMLRDRIVEVDGKSGTCYDLLSKFTGRTERTRTIKMLIQRNTSHWLDF
jgi:hypothetical protein